MSRIPLIAASTMAAVGFAAAQLIAVSPAEAQSRRAVGIIGAAAVGAIILNEVSRAEAAARRSAPRRTARPRSEGAPRQARREAPEQRRSTATAGTSAGTSPQGSDPFAGVAPVKTGKPGQQSQ